MCHDCQAKYSRQFQAGSQWGESSGSQDGGSCDRYKSARTLAPDIIADDKGIS